MSARAASSHELAHALRNVNTARREAMSPAESLIETLHPLVAFGIMPVFALANAGVSVSGGSTEAGSWAVLTGVALGLVLGKPVGVLLACWLMLKLRIGTLPAGVGASQLVVLGLVAGVGFTMALFVAQLAFKRPEALGAAKLGVLLGSAVAATLTLGCGRALLSTSPDGGAAQSADDAECSTEL
jgi:NhaA family Na+:H+ antiporter